MKIINLRESLLEMDRNTDFEHNLTVLYESMKLSEDKKKELVQYIKDYDIEATNALLSNEFHGQGLAEAVDDDLSEEDLKNTDFNIEITEDKDDAVYGVHHYPSEKIIFMGTNEECGLFIEDNNMWNEAEIYRIDITDPHHPKYLDEGIWDVVKDGAKKAGAAIKDKVSNSAAGNLYKAAKDSNTWDEMKDKFHDNQVKSAQHKIDQQNEKDRKNYEKNNQRNIQAAKDPNVQKYSDKFNKQVSKEMAKNGQQQQNNTTQNKQQGTNSNNKNVLQVRGKDADQFYHKGQKLTAQQYQKLSNNEKRDAVVVGTDGKYVQRGRDQKWVGKPAKVTQKRVWVAEDLNEEFNGVYADLVSKMDTDDKQMNDTYKQGELSPFDILVNMGYRESGEHTLSKNVTVDGKEYEQIFDFNGFDTFETDYYRYYVLEDGKIPSGWTDTKTILDEPVNEGYFSDDDVEDDIEHANIYGGDTTYCRECGTKKKPDEDGFFTCPKCSSLEEGYFDREWYDPKQGWTEEDIELHKSIDWQARDYKEYPVPEDNFRGVAFAYGLPGGERTQEANFIKYIRPNGIFPPYYAPDSKPFEGVVGPMADGRTHKTYAIHDRYETQEVYDTLSN